MRTRRIIAAGLAGLAIVAAAASQASAAVPPVHAQDAAPALTVTTLPGGIGLEVVAAPQDCTDTPLLQTDSNGAPMLWDTCYGLFSGGDGGAELGGQVCVTYQVAYCAASLTPEGTLVLTPTGPDGQLGPPQTLTSAEITELGLMIKAHVTFADLRWLAMMAGIETPARRRDSK